MDKTNDANSTIYNPLKQTSLIRPMDVREFTSSKLNTLYSEEQLTQDEYLVLDYIRTMQKIKGVHIQNSVTLSFQGMKRVMNLHQAKLTKALNRLVQKGLLHKFRNGYQLTLQGMNTHNKLNGIFSESQTYTRLPTVLFSHVIEGCFQGPHLSKEVYKIIEESLAYHWFGNYRFTSIVKYDDSFELSWISTEGKESISLLIGPENKIRLIYSSPNFLGSDREINVLIDKLSELIERKIDIPIEFSSRILYENKKIIDEERYISFAG